MVCFVDQPATRGTDLMDLVSDTMLGKWSGWGPGDPAAWEDWLACVRTVKEAAR